MAVREREVCGLTMIYKAGMARRALGGCLFVGIALVIACGDTETLSPTNKEAAEAGVPDAAAPVGDASPAIGDASVVTPPANHRPSPIACPTTRPPGYSGDGGAIPGGCTSDANCTQGTNGRCTVGYRGAHYCDYDQCAKDSDCTNGAVCECGAPDTADSTRFGNRCVTANCRVDSDCGPGGYCSPMPVLTPCDAAGYYCHKPGDECFNDSDCTGGAAGSCKYDQTSNKWKCPPPGVSTQCSG
jgi:hypothetical protein